MSNDTLESSEQIDLRLLPGETLAGVLEHYAQVAAGPMTWSGPGPT
jgi:hypothetical protein